MQVKELSLIFLAGVFPQIKEQNYYNHGSYRVDAEASPTMKNCLMYKLCYYNFDRVKTKANAPSGYDTVRNVEIGVFSPFVITNIA